MPVATLRSVPLVPIPGKLKSKLSSIVVTAVDAEKAHCTNFFARLVSFVPSPIVTLNSCSSVISISALVIGVPAF